MAITARSFYAESLNLETSILDLMTKSLIAESRYDRQHSGRTLREPVGGRIPHNVVAAGFCGGGLPPGLAAARVEGPGAQGADRRDPGRGSRTAWTAAR